MKKVVFVILLASCLIVGSVPMIAECIEDGLVAYYQFNGNAIDISGNGNDGIVNNAILTEDRFQNPNSNSYEFDGTCEQYIDVGNNLKPPHFPITVALWLYSTDPMANESQEFFHNDHRGPDEYKGIAVKIKEGHLRAWVGCGPPSIYGRSTLTTTTPVINENQWHHVAVVYHSANEFAIYVDGVEQDLHMGPDDYLNCSGNEVDYSIDGNGHIGIGWVNDVCRGYYGKIDEFRVYDRALIGSEISELAFNCVPVELQGKTWGSLKAMYR